MMAATADGKECQPSTSSSIECSQPCRPYTYPEIIRATNNFDESLVIGKGGFGKVYKANVKKGSTLVVAAIKRLDPESSQGEDEFLAEIKILSEVRHCNVVSLFGYCSHEKERILIYEYMANGSLEDHLHKLASPLSLLELLKICIDTARGLDYLHTGTGIDHGIIHRDIKSANILLDDSFAAKVSDCGLSRRGPKNNLSAYVYTIAKGTFGYLDPQFYSTGYGRLTRKSDVYAFGVILLEVLCRKPAVFGTYENAKNLAIWAQEAINKGNLMHIVDSVIKGQISTKCLKKFSQIAQKCLHNKLNERSTMAEVVVSLEALQGEINRPLQPARRTILGKMVDKFPFHSKGENTVHSKGGTAVEDDNTLIRVAVQKERIESFQEHDRLMELRALSTSIEFDEGSRYKLEELIGKGGSGIVCSAYDTHLGEKVAIKKISDIFEHVSVATGVLREIKLLRFLHHPDIVEIKSILLPPSMREFKDIYVVFELMEADLHQVIKANDDLTSDHHRFFLYQIFRGLKYVHTANVFHRDLNPKNILASGDCKLKICDFGISRPAFSDQPVATFWTDYIGGRWYRAPELCGSFFSKYTPAIDMWSIGCIFAEILTGKPLFPGRNVVHQLDLITDLLGTPSAETISRIRNDKAKRYLSSMRKKNPIPFTQKFPTADPLALPLLERMIAFEPKDRPTAEEALSDPYFKDLAKVEREPSAQPITKLEFEFETRKNTKEDIRKLIFREILEYHPNMLKEYLDGAEATGSMNPSFVEAI